MDAEEQWMATQGEGSEFAMNTAILLINPELENGQETAQLLSSYSQSQAIRDFFIGLIMGFFLNNVVGFLICLTEEVIRPRYGDVQNCFNTFYFAAPAFATSSFSYLKFPPLFNLTGLN